MAKFPSITRKFGEEAQLWRFFEGVLRAAEHELPFCDENHYNRLLRFSLAALHTTRINEGVSPQRCSPHVYELDDGEYESVSFPNYVLECDRNIFQNMVGSCSGVQSIHVIYCPESESEEVVEIVVRVWLPYTTKILPQSWRETIEEAVRVGGLSPHDHGFDLLFRTTQVNSGRSQAYVTAHIPSEWQW